MHFLYFKNKCCFYPTRHKKEENILNIGSVVVKSSIDFEVSLFIENVELKKLFASFAHPASSYIFM
jgi:hypothetical protein